MTYPMLFLLLLFFVIQKYFVSSKKIPMKAYIDFVKRWEGGLSSAISDTASKNPAPGSIYHTNKGITWTTYKYMSKELGYTPTTKDFLNLNDSRWFEIMKKGYWDNYNLDKLLNKKSGIAYFITSFAWGSGSGGSEKALANYQRKFMNIKDSDIKKFEITDNFYNDKMSVKDRLTSLIEYKRKYLISLNQPKNIKGWLRRLEDFDKTFNI
jgi:hypothetical protein